MLWFYDFTFWLNHSFYDAMINSLKRFITLSSNTFFRLKAITSASSVKLEEFSNKSAVELGS